MNTSNLLLWEGIVTQLAVLGVNSVKNIKALMADAGLDDIEIAKLTAKWDDLYSRVRTASGAS